MSQTDETSMLLGELRADIRSMRAELTETKALAAAANQNSRETKEQLATMRNRGYGFLAGLTVAAGTAGATIKSVFFGS